MRGKEEIVRRLKGAGAVAVGVAEAGAVSDNCAEEFERWLERDEHAGMDYMTHHHEMRMNPTLLVEGARSVISMAFSYRRDAKRPRTQPLISSYALLPDYHYWIKRDIRQSGVGDVLGEEGKDWRICVDSALVMERYWAVKSGVGLRGDNGAVIVPGIGSDVFLAEIITTSELECDKPLRGDCGHCGACRKACPTGALGTDGAIDCNLCLSYLTIEHRGEWTDARHLKAMRSKGGKMTLFGCDRCLTACPHNASGRVISTEPEVMEPIIRLDASDIGRPPKGSCLQRAGKTGLLRNALNCLESD